MSTEARLESLPFEAEPEALSIGQLHTQVRAGLRKAFPVEVWVSGEIKSVKEWRAAWFITLIEPGGSRMGGDLLLDVVCWDRSGFQQQLLGEGIRLQEGMEVRIRGEVTVSKNAVIQLKLTKIDTDALLGRAKRERERLLQTLKAEGLLVQNRSLRLPLVPLRIGLVTSEGSEGHRDFVGQLERSPYNFVVTLVHSGVQGPTAPANLASALQQLQHAEVDLVAVVRGGGGELDAFDKEPVARAIATALVPVWTGVGHTGDRSIADEVAHTACITPTACGQAIVALVSEFVERCRVLSESIVSRVASSLQLAESELLRNREALSARTESAIQQSEHLVEVRIRDLLGASGTALLKAESNLSHVSERIVAGVRQAVLAAETRHQSMRQAVEVFRPELMVQRGFSITTDAAGQIVRSVDQLAEGAEISTQLSDGRVRSVVRAREKKTT